MTLASVRHARSLVFRGDRVAVEDTAPAELGPGDLRVEVRACGVCGTDLEILSGRAFAGRLPLPLVPGHEVAGTVVEIAPQTSTDIVVGDLVVLHSIGACGDCQDCLDTVDNRCRRAVTLGLDRPGGFSTEVVWSARRAVVVTGLPASSASLLPDAVATAYHALNRAEVRQAGTLAVIGIGGLGTHLLQLATLTRPDLRLVGVGRSEQSLRRAQELGAATVSTLDAEGRAMARGLGSFDAVIDVSGADDAVDFGLATLKRGGRLVVASVHERPMQHLMTRTAFMTKELELVGSYGSTFAELQEVVRLARSGALDLSNSVSQQIPLSALPAALPGLMNRGSGQMRTVVMPDGVDGAALA